jgi:hypothetical protein
LLLTGDEVGTTARLRAEIDSGRTGDKVATIDPAAAPLGTDDEAAGTPPTLDAVALARRHELKYAHDRGDQRKASAALVYTALLAVIAAILVGVLFFIIPHWA